MSQHDMNIANDTGAAVRADINNALVALASLSSGATQPTTTFAQQLWADTTSGYLKQRNTANTGWNIIGKLSQDMLAAIQIGLFDSFTTGGTSTAYTLTTTPAMAALATGERFLVTFHTASGTNPTLARDGLTAKNLKQIIAADGTKAAAKVGTGQKVWVVYDGTDYVVLSPNLLIQSNTFKAAQRGDPVSLTSSGASIAIDLALANNFTHTTSENTTLAAPSNAIAGQSGVIVITQGATPRTLAYNSFWKFPGGTVPSLTASAGAVDVLAYYIESASRATCQLVGDVK